MTMNVLNNLHNLTSSQGLNSSSNGIGIQKLSSGNKADKNQTGLGSSGIGSSKSFTVSAYKTVSQKVSNSNSVQNTSDGKTSFTVSAYKTVSDNSQETNKSSSTQKIDNGQTSGVASKKDTHIMTEREATDRLHAAHDIANTIVDLVHNMQGLVMESAWGPKTDNDRSVLNGKFNDLMKNINDIAKNNFGAVDSQNKNNINFSCSRERSGSSNVLNFNLSFGAATSGLGLDNISIATKEDANKALDSVNKAYNTITNSRQEIQNGIMEINNGYGIHTTNVLKQASASELAQANQAPAAVLKLL